MSVITSHTYRLGSLRPVVSTSTCCPMSIVVTVQSDGGLSEADIEEMKKQVRLSVRALRCVSDFAFISLSASEVCRDQLSLCVHIPMDAFFVDSHCVVSNFIRTARGIDGSHVQ